MKKCRYLEIRWRCGSPVYASPSSSALNLKEQLVRIGCTVQLTRAYGRDIEETDLCSYSKLNTGY